MAGQYRFKDQSGNVVAQISASADGTISFSGSTANFSQVNSVNLGSTTITGTATNSNAVGGYSSSAFVFTSSFNTISQSISSQLNTLQTTSGSNIGRLNNLESKSSSVDISISNINSVTSSFSPRVLNLESKSASVDISISNINSVTASNLARLSNLESTSASVNISISNINSVTSSFSPRVSNLETKSSSVDISISNINSFTASNNITSLNSKTGSYATTGSNTFFGTQTYSGSVYIANDLIVQGSSSIQYISASSVSIGTNIVQLNTANPSVRFAGLSIIDSGSVGGSGSFLYDSREDEFIFVHRGNGTNVTSSHFVMGPETFDNLGNEIYLTSNIIPKGTGKEHLVDSCIFDNGTTVCVNATLKASGQVCGVMSNFSCVGIGTTSPAKTLHVVNTDYQLRLSYDTSGVYTDFRNDSAGGLLINTSGQYIINYINGSAKMRIDADAICFSTTICSPTIISSGTICSISNTCFGGNTIINGCVGMGTATPTAKLHVYCNADVWHTKIGSACGELRIGGDTSCGAVIQSYTPAGVVRDLYLQRDGGKIGIGTNIPTALLDIYHPTNGYASVGLQGYAGATKWYLTSGISGDTIQDFSISNNNDGTIPKFRISSTGITTFACRVCAPTLEITSTNTNIYPRVNRTSTSYEAGWKLSTAGADSWYTGLRSADGVGSYHFYSYTTNTSVVSITCGGCIGIGNSTPESTLHINGTNSGGYGASLTLTNVGTAVNTATGIDFGVDASTAGAGLGNAQIKVVNIGGASGTNCSDMIFSLWNGASFNERLKLISNGNVCIPGNLGLGLVPGSKLSVNGNISLGTSANYNFAGPSQYGGITLPRGEFFFSNTNTQNQFYLASNAYNNVNGVFAYRNNGCAASIGLDNGAISFLTGPNGTADVAVNWASPLSIANAGTVTIGGGNLVNSSNNKSHTFCQLNSTNYSTKTFVYTGNSVSSFAVTDFSGIPSNAKAVQVYGWYHITGYGNGAGQGDHAMSWFGPATINNTTQWGGPGAGWPAGEGSYTPRFHGTFVMEHDGDSSGTGMTNYMNYYGSWHQGTINVHTDGNIYYSIGAGLSGGTHYNALVATGYWI
jgi:hypothetical protein